MAGINLMNIAKGGLLSHQTAIDLAGSNISNINTPGYTRQRAVFNSVANLTMGAQDAQTGVIIKDIERVYDQFIASQIAGQTHAHTYSDTRREELGRVEVIFNNYNEGIGHLMDEFWCSLGDLSMDPSSHIERVAVLSAAQSMAESFRSVGEQLVSQQESVNTQVVDLVREANDHIDALADLNEKVMQTRAGQGNVNDLLDKRTAVVDELAALIDFSHMEDADGAVNLFLSDGTPLVLGLDTWHLELGVDEENSSFYTINVEGASASSAPLAGGKIAALLDIRDRVIGGDEGYLQKLDDFVAVFADELNTLHRTGYDMYGNMGGDFFTRDETRDYAWLTSLAVDDAVAADVNRIAASATVNGDGMNALEMGALKDSVVTLGDRQATINNHYSTLVAGIAQDVADSKRLAEHHLSLMNQLTNQREEVSGVSIDEEMLNLVRFQMGYSASARLCNVADEMIEELLQLSQ
ncbi:MAG: hypothetical protein AVO39_10040 [delta proteobacterium MLS_D]|jgi:flagellar hook-associated protein 1|nr:MAG: hypothetical protein AVO39_10040 [delta proteobacterium MLS_D]